MWFGRPPHQYGQSLAPESNIQEAVELPIDTPFTNINAKALLEAEDDAANEEYLLSELHRRVLLNNIMIVAKAAIKRSDPKVFTIGQIILLAIPAKNRLTREAPRLPCRVVKVAKGVYTLLSQFGRIKGAYQASSLRAILTSEDYGIPMEPINKTKTITLPSAVTQYYNRLSIGGQQKQGSDATKAKAAGKVAAAEAKAEGSKAGASKRKRALSAGELFTNDLNHQARMAKVLTATLTLQQRVGVSITRVDFERISPLSIQERINANEAEAIALQDELDEQFARDARGLLVKDARAEAIASKIRETRSQALAGSSIQVGEASLVTPTPATRVRKKVVR